MSSKEQRTDVAIGIVRATAEKTAAGEAIEQPKRMNFIEGLLRRIYETVKINQEKSDARVVFAKAMSNNSRERRGFRLNARDSKFETRTIDEGKHLLKDAWQYNTDKHSTDTRKVSAWLIRTPDEIQHSKVAAEYVARIAILPQELRINPKVLYKEAGKAYRSINWRTVTREEEADLRTVIEKTFAEMHKQARDQNIADIPLQNDKLWRGLGDYYLSANIPSNESVPTGADPKVAQEISLRNEKRRLLRERLKKLQDDVSQATEEREEIDILRKTNEMLRVGAENGPDPSKKPKEGQKRSLQGRFNPDEVMESKRRLGEELEGYPKGGGRGAGRESAIGEAAAVVELQDLEGESPTMNGLFSDMQSDDLAGLYAATDKLTEDDARVIRLRLLQLKKFFNEEAEHPTGASGLSIAKDTIFNLKRDYSRSLNADQLRHIDSYGKRIENAIEVMRQRGQPPSRFYLSYDKMVSLDRDPIGTIDKMAGEAIEQIMKDPQNPIARVKMEQMDLANYYFFDDRFDERKIDNVVITDVPAGVDVTREMIRGVRERFRNRLGGEKERFAEAFTMRYNAARFVEQWSNADGANNTRFQEMVNMMNESDFFGLDGMYGGLVVRARQILRTKYEGKILNAHGRRNALNPIFWDEAIEETIAEMSGNKEFDTTYRHYLNGEFFKEIPFTGGKSTLAPTESHARSYTEACRTIVNFADVRMVMSMEKYNLDVRFAPAAWGVATGQIPSTFLEKQKIARIMRPFEYHFMTWGSMNGRPGFEKTVIRQRARVMRTASPEIDGWAEDSAARYWKRIQSYKTESARTNLSDADKVRLEAERMNLYGEIAGMFYFIPDERDGAPKPKDAVKFGEWLDKMNQQKLTEEFKVYRGMQIDQQHTMRPYMVMFESGYRRDSELRFLQDALEEAYGGNKEQMAAIFTAERVVGRANGYFMQKYTGDPESARKEFVEAMADVARWRPHSLAMVLVEGESTDFENNWINPKVGGIASFGRMYEDTSLVYEEIRANLLDSLNNQVDYSKGIAGLDEAQFVTAYTVFKRRHVEGAPHSFEQEMTAYFDRMKSLSHYLRGDSGAVYKPPEDTNLRKNIFQKVRAAFTPKHGHFGEGVSQLADIRYAPLLTKARWDDYPDEWLEYPERIQGAMIRKGHTNVGPIRKVTARFIGERAHDEQSGPWRRMWRDAGGAQTVMNDMGVGAFEPDDKQRKEAQHKMYGVENSYQGPGHAEINVLMAEAGIMGAFEVYPQFGPLMENAAGSSDVKRFYNPALKSKSPDELKEMMEGSIGISSGKVSVNATDAVGIEEAIQDTFGISRWGRYTGGHHGLPMRLAHELGVETQWVRFIEYMNENHPSGVRAMKLWAIPLLAGGFLLFYAFSEATEGQKKTKA